MCMCVQLCLLYTLYVFIYQYIIPILVFNRFPKLPRPYKYIILEDTLNKTNSSKLYLAQLATASIMAPEECHKDVTWSSLSCFTVPFLSSFLQYGRAQRPAG